MTSLSISIAVVCLAGTVAQPSCGVGSTPLPVAQFRDISDEALVNRFEPDLASLEATEFVRTDPESGLTLRQRPRWLPEQSAFLLESAVINESDAPSSAERVSLAHWDFRVSDTQDAGRYRDLTYRNDEWYGSTYWTGPNWTRVGKDWHHPGESTPSVRRFTAPRDGRITVTGRVYKADTNNGGGDGVRLEIRHGRECVWQAELDGDDAQGVEPDLSLNVRKGDAIRFVVHKRGKIYCDTTHWDPLVVYSNGARFQASEGFSTANQGDNGWSYEMEVDPNDTTGLPAVHAFTRDTLLREETPTVGAPVAFSRQDALPCIVVADASDKSGLALALTEPSPWHFSAATSEDGLLSIAITAGDQAAPLSLQPGESRPLPQIALLAYEGAWGKGVSAVQALLDSHQSDAHIAGLGKALSAAGHGELPKLDLWAVVQTDWRQQDKLTESVESYATATRNHIEKAQQLLNDLRKGTSPTFLASGAEALAQLAPLANAENSLEEWSALYLQVRKLKRAVALKNPLLDFDRLLFCKRVPTSYSHLVMQYYGWRARPGGSLFVLDNPGYSLKARDLLDGRLSAGNILEPRLSYDGERIVFSYVVCTGKSHDYNKLNNEVDEDFYHIWEVNVDGTGLRQLTSGPYDDTMPTYLPDGGIAFCSTRRKGYARCFGAQFSPRWHVYTLHRMNGDGTDIQTLSFHDTNEWFPTVSNTGLILYSRWDYIDRDAVTHQNLWATRPDGTNPIAVWGNATSSPHCTFQLQPIPDSNKVVFAASAHHSIAGGSIALVDPTRGDDGEQAVTRITPEIPFPEAEGRDIHEYYAAPWPLSERYFLVAYSPTPLVWEPGANARNALGLYLLDAAGNRELIYRDPDIGSTNPCPLRPRPMPPVVPSTVVAGKGALYQASESPSETGLSPFFGEMFLMNVNEGLGDIPPGSIKALRIIQIFPKTTHVANTPPIGLAREENGRAVLGTVPVEADGSARFLLPARTPILFQTLDENGFAYQTMRSLTYVQPGERVSCIGCHENRMTTTGALPAAATALAMRRPPSEITPGPFEGEPFSFMRVVQPILDQHCVKCHSGAEPKKGLDLTGIPEGGFTKSYLALCGDRDFWSEKTNLQNAAEALVPRFGGRNQVQVTPPGGAYGARGSRLIKMLRQGHSKVQLTDEELRRIAMWIDCNAIFYGVNPPEDQARQLRAEAIPIPEIQ